MANINKILNGEPAPSVRDKLNEVIDKVNASAVVVPVGDAAVFDPLKAGGYRAGSIISYRNEASPDAQFQTFAIYVANSDIPVGVSPEDSDEWLFKGAEYTIEGGNTSKNYVSTITALRSVSDMKNGDTIIVGNESRIYEFVESSESGIKPFQAGVGSWMSRTRVSLSNISRVYTSLDAMGGEEIPLPVGNVVISFADSCVFTITDGNGDAQLPVSLSQPSIVTKVGAGFLASDIEVEPIGGGGGGHTILDPDENTMPTQPALQFGAGFTVTDEEGKTVVGNAAASHINGADEEKHQTSQIYDDLIPLSTILPQLVNLADIDVSDINVGEKKIIVAEKNAQGDPVFSGGVGLLDVIANSGLSTLLAETNPNWIGDEITLTGNNLDGQLGENSQFFELDADFFLCKAHDNGTTTTNGSATWKRNRGTDSLSLSIPAHVTIINQLETETGWNSVVQFKQITAKSKQGSWFRRSTGGYLYMCLDNSNGWTRVGTPPTTDLEITSTSHPVLTASLAAHDFSTNRFYVEGTEPTDEPAEQGQEWWDATNKHVYRRNMDGNWARING